MNITLSVPNKLYQDMKKHKELKWSEVARAAFQQKIAELELVEKILSKSKLTEKDAEEIGDAIKVSLAKKYGKQ